MIFGVGDLSSYDSVSKFCKDTLTFTEEKLKSLEDIYIVKDKKYGLTYIIDATENSEQNMVQGCYFK